MKRLYLFILVSMLLLMMNWEYQRTVQANVITNNQTESSQTIPEDAIRLRILAHSDSPQDQWLKRQVRDVVVDKVNQWVTDIGDIEEAREYLIQSTPVLEKLVQQTITEAGFSYTSEIEFGEISFPVKLYGNKLYPAGEYEGILITIGAGQGDNWWCVLFPPLCFVDFGTGDVAEQNNEQPNQTNTQEVAKGQQVEVRFFLVDLFQQVVAIFS